MPPNSKSKTAESSPKPKRGRPVGTFKHPGDRTLIAQAARFLNTGHAPNARQAFVKLTGNDDRAIRRLQRHWEQHGEEMLQRDRIAHRERCELEYRSLRDSAPDLWVRVEEFVRSRDGQRFLEARKRADGEPAHPMAIGIAVLMEAVEDFERRKQEAETNPSERSSRPRLQPDPTDNSLPNQRRFDRVLEAWFSDGSSVTPASLRALATRAQELADALEADLAREDA